jgi:hypothetical protein
MYGASGDLIAERRQSVRGLRQLRQFQSVIDASATAPRRRVGMPRKLRASASIQLRASNVDFTRLRKQRGWSPNTSGVGLALGLNYFRFEAFATVHDRDACWADPSRNPVRVWTYQAVRDVLRDRYGIVSLYPNKSHGEGVILKN